MTEHQTTERWACRVLGVNRTAFRYESKKLPDEDNVREAIIHLATSGDRVGYRTVTGRIRNNGFNINHKRIERIYREEGLKLPRKQCKRQRIYQADGSCVRLRANRKNHVWSYDFIEDKTMDKRKVR